MSTKKESARRAEALSRRLYHVIDRFLDGRPVEAADYPRILNTLCKTLLELEYAAPPAPPASRT